MGKHKWPPPGFPLVEGEHRLTDDWSMNLPGRFARRVEEGELVLWRPGLTVWLAAWVNTNAETQGERLAWVKQTASPDRHSEQEDIADGMKRFRYRLREDNDDGAAMESLYGFVIADEGHLELAVYFDDPADEKLAHQLLDGVTRHHA